MKKFLVTALISSLLTLSLFSQASYADAEMRFIQVAASTREQRTAIANTGMSIEATRSDSVWGFATPNAIRSLQENGFQILGDFDYQVGRGGHEGPRAFPPADSRFHTYAELVEELQKIQAEHPDFARMQSIGKTTEARDIWAIHFNTSQNDLDTGISGKPGAIFMGNHHAREHVSLEVPLMLAQYLANNRGDAKLLQLLASRDIWIIPSVNPDGAEFDVSTRKYRYWRKNRRNNGDGTQGVDLNRNYSFGWGTGGSSKDTDSDIYMGPSPFSEPETIAVRDFVDAHLNAKVLLTFHSFSELILYPWGGKFTPVPNERDLAVFRKMAQTMAAWNRYKPEQASQLYIASGDTTDWAYGTHGIFAFTFELSPKDMSGGGFYPGAKVLDRVFNDNLQPCLYLLDAADDPYKVMGNRPTGFLRNYVEPQFDESTYSF